MADTHQGCVAIITGAGRGLGRTMALGLLQAGAQVTGAEIDAPALDELNSAAGAARQRLLPFQADVTREDEARGIIAQTLERFGRVDVLVNNAGLNITTVDPDRIKSAPSFRDVEPADYRRIFEVNAIGPFLVARAAVEPMLKQKWGRIIGVTTSLDTMYRKGMMPYGATKAAHECLVAALADELEGTGVTANVLVPGGAAITRMTRGYGAAQSKMIQPEVMVKPLLWLASRASDGVNGRRFIGARWDDKLAPAEAAEKCSAPAAWPQLGRQSVVPDGVR
jgi:NAD(P)-dependent dehydrogenase (short-subunit alcohol dehydrogenase family)